MSKAGPIILVDDDHDDMEIFSHVLQELGISNQLVYFSLCEKAMDYLLTTDQKPFIIFCDVNMPGYNGIEFKKNIDSTPELRRKSIPFVFYSTSTDQATVNKAYIEMTVQGFFQKPSQVKDMKRSIKMILAYWEECRHPNSE